MLFNPKWAKKHDPLTIEALAKWLETKNPEEHYTYGDASRCLARQYNDSIGRKYTVPRGFLMWLRRPFDWFMEMNARNGEHTFGAALERVRKHL